MHRPPVPFALVVLLLSMGAAPTSARHGGAPPLPPPYSPPPPAYGGPPGRGPSGPGPSAPPPSSPTTPAPGSPVAPTPTPAAPNTPPAAGISADLDLSYWSYWWYFNRQSFWDLSAHLDASAALTGSDDFFLGHGGAEETLGSLRPDEAVVRTQIRPALIAALVRESSADVLTACTIALARLGPVEGGGTSSALRALLPHANQEVAETAALGLGLLGRDQDIPLLAALVLDTDQGRDAVETTRVDARVRAFAAYGLGFSARAQQREDVRRFAVHSLVQALREGAGERQDLAAACVLALGLCPPPPVRVQELDPEAPPASSAQALLAWLLEYAHDPAQADVARAHALTSAARVAAASAELGDESAREPVVRACLQRLDPFDDEARELRQSAVLALGFLLDDDGDELDALGRAELAAVPERFPDQSTRNFALIALARIAGRPGAGDTAGVAREEVRAHLHHALARGASLQRPWSALALGLLARRVNELGEVAPAAWLAPLRSRLEEERSAGDLSAWALALGLARDESVGALLRERFLDRRDPYARGHLAEGLGLCGERRSKALLRENLAENLYRPVLLAQLSLALGLLEDAEAVPVLVEMLSEANSLASQASIAAALGRIGDRRALPALFRLLEDADRPASARAFAAVALGMIGDLRTLPWSAPLAEGVNYRAATATLFDAQGRGVLNLL